MSSLRCPLCPKSVQTRRGLIKHLVGSKRYGGHELDAGIAVATADTVISAAASSALRASPPPPTEPAPGHDSDAFLAAVLLPLVDNKVLPKFQFERAIGPLLGVFLPEILEAKKGWNVKYVVSEFPIKKLDSNRSTNIDELFYRKPSATAPGGWIFFELKTDRNSVRKKQIYDYLNAKKRGMPALIRDLPIIAQRSRHKAKYDTVIKRLAPFPIEGDIDLVYLSPEKVQLPSEFGTQGHALSFDELETLELTRFAPEWDLFRKIVLPKLA